MKSTQNTTRQHLTTSLARRALLLVSFLLFSLGGVWGEPFPYDGSNSQPIFKYTNLVQYEDCSIKFTFISSQKVDQYNSTIGAIHKNGDWSNVLATIQYLDGSVEPNNPIIITYQVSQLTSISNGSDLLFNLYNGATLQSAEIIVPETGGFINSNESNVLSGEGTSAPKDRDSDASGTLKFSEISIPNVTNLSEIIKYARIYVTDGSNTKLDYTQNAEGMSVSLLKVTGKTYEYPEGVSPQNGVAVYNNGASLDDFTITLNAGIGKLNQYKIVVLLSKNGIDGTGEDAKEPDWDYKYTYTFTYPSSTEEIIVPLDVSIFGLTEIKEQSELNIHRDIFDRLYFKDCQLWDGKYLEFVEGWYACWYVTDANGNKQSIQSSADIGNNVWTVTNGDQSYCWKLNDNIVWSDNNADGNTKQQWWVKDYIAAGKTRIATPAGTTFGDYGGYKIVFEITNEYSGGAPNNIPEIKLRYVFEIPSSFTGELRNPEWKAGETLTVDSRSAYNKNFIVDNTDVKKHISQPKYARFFVVDAKDPTNPVDSDVKLNVAYDGNAGEKPCIKPEDGFYIFNDKNVIDLTKITVTLEASKKYKLYNVIGVFSTDLEGAKYDETILIREPDWDLQYTYSFTYNPTTNKYDEQQVEWKRNGIKPVASVGNIDTEWDTSWDELALGYYVKWYIKNGDEIQPLAKGSDRQNGTWTIDVSGFTVNTEKEAVLTGTGTFNWNTWGKPTIYAPADKEFANVEDCKIICEVYANSDITGKNPNARYTFSLYKNFLDELKIDDSDHKGSETIEDLDKDAETVQLNLGNALESYQETIKTRTPGVVQYARVWLEGTDGMETPNGKLVIDGGGMKPYSEENPEYAQYGYYLAGENINDALNGLTATVNLQGAFNKYQVHVALSTDFPSKDGEGNVTAEPDYDYKYTYSFAYHLEIVPTEDFPHIAKKDAVKGYGSQPVEKTDASGTFKLSAIAFPGIADMSDIRYARIYVIDNSNGASLDFTSQVNGMSKQLLEVTDGQEAGSKTNGLFIYDGGNTLHLDDFNVILNAGANHMEDYRIMVLLSTDPISVDGTDSKEPKWDYEYIYKFTYLTEIYERLDDSVLDEQKVYITKNTDILNFFEVEAEEFAESWYNQWYVVKDITNLNVKEGIESSSNTSSSNWIVTHFQNGNENTDWPTGRWQLSNNVVWADNRVEGGNGGWFIEQIFANYTRICFPQNYKKEEPSKIILEVTDKNNDGAPNNPPAAELRYIFDIPVPDNFPGQANGTDKGDGSKNIARETTTESFTLAEATGYANAVKYVRIVLCDVEGNPLDDQSKLVVTYDGNPAVKAGRRLRNGVYVYNNGAELDKTKIKITLNGGLGSMTKYRIKCLLASSDNNIDIEDGRVTKEPNWDYEYTYRFIYTPDRGQFEALNINDVKTKYKTAVYNTGNRQTTIGLFSNWYEVMGDCNVSKEGFRDAYVRWYLTDATTGEVIAGIDNLTADDRYIRLNENYGYYRQGFEPSNFREGKVTTSKEGDYEGYNPTITLASNVNYQNVRVVCVVTTLLDYIEIPDHDPETVQVKYVYTLMTNQDLENANNRFVHYVGESHRNYLTPTGASGATHSWDYTTGKDEAIADGSIRQDVHQTDYYVYIDPADANAENLLLALPLEHWAQNADGLRNSTEPLAYFRWYDWYSDKKSDYLEIYKGDVLKEKNYGLIAMMLSGSSGTPYRDEIGVKFNEAGRNALSESNEIVIACDVSRYMDGLDDSKKYLIHEPTLSMRYLFHILPASKIAKEINAAAGMLEKVEEPKSDAEKWEKLGVADRAKVFQLYEDNGRVVVPLEGEFALRVDLQGLNQYFIDEDYPKQCNQLQWYSYYEDEKGDLWKMAVNMGNRSTLRLGKYTSSEFKDGYTKVGDASSEPKPMSVSIVNGTQLNVIGYLGNGEVEQAVVRYGLVFINEKPAKLGQEPQHRTDYYMNERLAHGGTLNFDDFFTEATRYNRPMTSYENYADAPMVFEDAQYGYCYPQLYGQCASTWQIYHGAWWSGYGFAPTHSDYTLLKSMNVPGISASETYDNQSFYTYWYDEYHQQLFDVTHERLSGKDGNDDKSKYGTFLYVDAADEARTIAHLKFEADLCASSEIFYSAYVANMTTLDQTPPQVMFRVSTDIDDENGGTKRIPVISFLTGDLMSQGAGTPGEWYQVYGSAKIPKELEHIVNGEPRTYYVSIDNYSENTKGADYAIDQISFYTTTATIEVIQSSTPCDESSGIEVAILADADKLIDVVHGEKTTLYYRIFRKNTDAKTLLKEDALIGQGIYKNTNGPDTDNYGSIEFPGSYLKNNLPTDILEVGESGFYMSGDKVYFQFDRREFDLDTDEIYFVSFYMIGTTPIDNDLTGWGNPYTGSVCETMYSNDIIPRMLRIDFKEPNGTDYDDAIIIPCDVQEVEKTFTITVQYPMPNGGYSPNTVFFDYYMGEKSEFKSIYELVEDGERLYLEKALERFRANYPNGEYDVGNLPDHTAKSKYDAGKEYTEPMYKLIKANMNKLKLLATNEFNYKFTTTGKYKFAAIPVVRETADGYICSPLEFVFEVEKTAGGPQLALGFEEVTYPNDYTRVVRVGLEQLNKVKANSGTHTLHIPVHSFEYKNKDEADNSIVFYGEDLVLWSTTDPANKVPQEGKKPVVATLLNDNANADRPMVNSDHQYLAVKFNDGFTFHEGYQYELHTVYYDLEDDEKGEPSTEACTTNDLTFIIKVVPKYVTWNGGSTQWNDDSNWNRSTKEDLYKESGYDNTQGINPPPSEYPAFVPMKFTYVTMPKVSTSSSVKAPVLVNLTTQPETGSDKKDEGIYTNIGSTTTDNIEYDLMVRYTEEKCITEGHKGYETGANIYDCEKFYSNWAKEIYFKPGAELVYQHYLTYEKAWVEKELTANTWTLMSTPLQNTYAGDMYVPISGRQETEAFTDINFGNGYSRTLYPIYQRSWAQSGSKVYTKTNDVRKDWYSANLVTSSVGQTLTQWSHTYNDVMVDYSTWKGFAIRAHKKEQKDNQEQDVLALLRLPKKDESFSYYDWNGNPPQTTNQDDKPNRAKYGKLFTDDDTAAPDDYGLTYGVVYDYGTTEGKKERTAGDGNVTESVSNIQSAQGYQLVGNPYLCSINMAEFLAENIKQGNLESGSGYWTYENNSASAYTKGQIRPLQSFFVKAKSDAELVFNEDMMIDGNTNPIQSSAPALTMTANNGHGQSMATLSVGEEARSVETLFDSNLEDVPMVYTVADGQAVSIHQVMELNKPIAFGVTCAASDELVEVTFSDVAQLTNGDVYVVDAVTGEQTAVGEGSTLSLQPNDYGRYYLLAGTTDITDKVDMQKGIMVSVRGREVTVTSGEELTQVHALSLTGATVYQDSARNTTTSFTLPSGVYIIQAKNAAGEQQTVKVIVK